MKAFKIIILGIFAALSFSCDDFLDVENYNGVPADGTINSVKNAQTALNGAYNTLYGDYLYYYGYYFYTDLSSGELVSLKTDLEMNPYENFNYSDTHLQSATYWKNLYSMISRANDVCTKIHELRDSKTLPEAENKELDKMIGECNFLRGFAYFYLVRSFGDKLPSHPQYNPEGLGVPIMDTLIVKKEQLIKPRNTLKECWGEVIQNFETAYKLLPDSWANDKLGAARKGSAAAYLGEVYMYMKNYEEAKKWFQKVINDEANYSLVENYAWNFDPYHENNKESIFEVQFQTTNDYTVLSSYLWRRLAPDGIGGSFGMVAVNNDWVSKFSLGFEFKQSSYDKLIAEMDAKPKYTETDIALKEILEAYKPYINVLVQTSEELFELYTGDWNALGDQINTIRRANGYRTNVKNEPAWGTINSSYMQTILSLSQDADPRMYDSFYVPNRDSVALDWAATQVIAYPNPYYGFKKYIPYNAPSSWTAEDLPYAEGFNSINHRIFRLADLYLQYAEACYQSGDMGNAKKYMNKVRRRGWKQPFDDISLETPNDVDYDGSTDFMTELIAEREKELCLEGHLWFDYLRWNKAEELFTGRGFNPKKYHRLPIPLSERITVGTDVLLQNENY